MSIHSLLVLSVLILGAMSGGVNDTAEHPRIEIVAPNPVTDGNAGEYIVLSIPSGTTLRGWSLEDRHSAVELPNTEGEAVIAISADPTVTVLLVDKPVVAWEGHLSLAATGDTVWLRDPDGTIRDQVSYNRTDSGHEWARAGESMQSSHADHLQPFARHADVSTRPFVLPDQSLTPNAVIEGADERLVLSGYELSDPEIIWDILERHEAGVDVQILVDGRPVGGQSTTEVDALDRLSKVGIPIRVRTGSRDAFRFHHPKYAVADETAIIMTENWKQAGTGGTSSRGWGVVVRDERVVTNIITVFDTDFGSRGTINWKRYTHTVNGQEVEAPDRDFPKNYRSNETTADAVRLITAPEHAETSYLDAIANASESIDVQQVRIGGHDFRLFDALVRAAERGVTVRVMLDRTWYVQAENEGLRKYVETLAHERELAIEVRLVDPENRFEKIHTKGMIVDQEVVFVGSMNWNDVSMRDNREVILRIDDTAAASFYATVFEEDWATTAFRTPVGVIVATLTVWLIAGLIARRVVSFHPNQSS